MTPRSNNVAKIVPTTLFFLGRSTGVGGIVPARRTTGVCPGKAARALRAGAGAITVGSSVAGACPVSVWPENPWLPRLLDAKVVAGEPPPITTVELGLPPAIPGAR